MSTPVEDFVAEEQTAPDRKGRSWTRPLLLLLSIAFTVAVVWWLAQHNKGFSFEQFAEVLRRVHPGWLGLAVLLCVSAYVVRSLRWASFIEPYAPNANKLDLLGNTFIGFAAVVVLGRPAELVRPYLISRQIQARFPTQVGAWLLERIYDLLSVLVLAAWALLTIDASKLPVDSPVTAALRAGGGMILLASITALALLIVFTFAGNTAKSRLNAAIGFLPERKREHFGRLIEAFVSALGVSRNPKCFQGIIAWTALHWLIVGAGTWAILQSFPAAQHVGPAEAFRFVALLALASAIPLPGLVGSYFIVSALLLTEWLGLPLEDASGITLIAWTLQLGISLPLGALAALRSGLNWRKIKSMEQEARL